MELSEALVPERISLDLRAVTKEGAIRELAELAGGSGALADVTMYIERALEREFLLSTGVGRGVAIPHAQAAGAAGLGCCLGLSSDGIDFEAIDDEPVRIVCMIVAQEGGEAEYLLLLSRISRLFAQRHVREQVLAASSAADAIDVIRRAEASDASA